MEEKSLRKFQDNGKIVQFNTVFFKNLIRDRKDKDKINIEVSKKEIADMVGVSEEAVTQWYNGYSGPGSIALIKTTAQFFNISYDSLLKEVKKENPIELENEQIQSVKRVFDAIICFLCEFRRTGGFTPVLWWKYLEKGIPENRVKEKITEYADDRLEEVKLVLMQEYFYLHDSPIYDILYEYILDDLCETYDGKLSQTYRFDEDGENHPSAEEDYLKALEKIDCIIEAIRNKDKDN